MVLWVGVIHTETNERMVVYRNLGGSEKKTFVRPQSMFEDVIDGKERFSLVQSDLS